MTDLELRIAVVVGVTLATLAAVWLVRLYVARQRRLVLANHAPVLPIGNGEGSGQLVRILSFCSDDCRQCHTLQAPALERVRAARGAAVLVTEVDAPTSPDLVERFRVMTLPSTVVLDATGRARAVNYGYADTARLLKQVDDAIAEPASARS